MNDIALKDIAGYMTEKGVWRLVKELATVGTPVWDIGAQAFYALMGVEVLGGKGAAAQNADTLVPRIGPSHCGNQLSDTIHRCLAFNPAERPTVEELLAVADAALKAKSIPPQRLVSPTGKNYKASLLKFWPEEMCPVVVLLMMLLAPTGLRAQSQVQHPQEMEAIVKRCIDLRDPANANRVERAFYNDSRWTLMDELEVDRNGECTIHNKVGTLGLNEMGYRIAKYSRGVSNTGGRFRNGQDPRYNYSLIEVTAKQNATVSYDITGREGTQIFAVVPYKAGASFNLTLNRNGVTSGQVYEADGVKYIAVNDNVKPDDVLTLRIANTSGGNLAFVIINYNSRQLAK